MSDETVQTDAPSVPQDAPFQPRHAPTAMPQEAPGCPTMPPDAPLLSIRKNKANFPPRPLTPRQLAAVQMLLGGWRVADIHRRLGIDRKTLFRWRRMRTFVDEVWKQHGLLCEKAYRERAQQR